MNAAPIHSESWVVEQPEEFRVSLDAYRGEALFEAEMERIFSASWVYLGHESEVARPGDLKSTMVGLQPVILLRDASGGLRAFLNFCTHRGAALVREERSHARHIVCPYHGWAFRLSGELVGVTDRDRYPPGFKMEDKGLIPLAQVQSYGGLVFGSIRPTVPLEQHLGEARRYIDVLLARAAGSTFRVSSPHRYAYPGNWKFQVENVVDGYHPMVVHRSALNAFKKLDLLGNRVADESSGVRQGGLTRGFPGGHGLLSAGSARDPVFLDAALNQAYKDRLAARHGAGQVNALLANQHLVIFPNLALMDLNIRVIQPRAPGQTDVYSYPLLIEGESDAFNGARLQELQMRLGTAGMVQTDDIDIFGRNQTGLRAQAASHVVLSRGLGLESVLPSGERVGEYGDETPQRAFWRQWAHVMGNAAGEAPQRTQP